ncbi:MAG: heavy-metal-associated domain-containing protein [Candidatus Poseidoniaceae archaeon]
MGLFSKADTHEFTVSGMDCGGCERKITNALTSISGVKKVTASASNGTVTVVSKGVSKEDISTKIHDSGFTVNP